MHSMTALDVGAQDRNLVHCPVANVERFTSLTKPHLLAGHRRFHVRESKILRSGACNQT